MDENQIRQNLQRQPPIMLDNEIIGKKFQPEKKGIEYYNTKQVIQKAKHLDNELKPVLIHRPYSHAACNEKAIKLQDPYNPEYEPRVFIEKIPQKPIKSFERKHPVFQPICKPKKDNIDEYRPHEIQKIGFMLEEPQTLTEQITINIQKKNKWNDVMSCQVCGREYTRSNTTQHRRTGFHKMHLENQIKLRNIMLSELQEVPTETKDISTIID